MTNRSLGRRLAALERQQDDDDDDGGVVAFFVDIGDDAELDDWQRRHPDAITVNIGGSTNDDENRDT